MVKNLPTKAGDKTHKYIPGLEDSLEEGKATHPSILAWRIPWAEEPGGLQSMGPQSQTQLCIHSKLDVSCSLPILFSLTTLVTRFRLYLLMGS